MPLATRSPVLPTEFSALVPGPDAGICEVIVAFFKFQLVWWRWHKYAFNSDGSLSTALKAEICDGIARCGELNDPNSAIYQGYTNRIFS